MAGVGDELLLGLHVFQVRQDGPPGQEDHQNKHHHQTDPGNDQRDPEQGVHPLQLPLRVEEENHRLLVRRVDQIAVAALIALGLLVGQGRVCIGFGILLRDGSDMILIHPEHGAVGVIVDGEEAEGILHLRREVRPVVKGRGVFLAGKGRPLVLHLQQVGQCLVLLVGHAVVVPEIHKAQQGQDHGGKGRHRRADEAPAHLLQHGISSRA